MTTTQRPIASNRIAHDRAQRAQARQQQPTTAPAPRAGEELFDAAEDAPSTPGGAPSTPHQPAEQAQHPAQIIGAQRVYTVNAVSPTGWPVSIAFADISLKDFEQRLDQLDRRGYRPPASDWPTTPEGLPICRKHGVPMRKREKQGDVWYSHNMGTEQEPCYCRGYAGKDSPGWER